MAPCASTPKQYLAPLKYYTEIISKKTQKPSKKSPTKGPKGEIFKRSNKTPSLSLWCTVMETVFRATAPADRMCRETIARAMSDFRNLQCCVALITTVWGQWYDNNVLMFSFEGIMKLMTKNSQEKAGCLRSSISLFPNKLNINCIIIRFPTYPITNRWAGHPLLSTFSHFQWPQIFINATYSETSTLPSMQREKNVITGLSSWKRFRKNEMKLFSTRNLYENLCDKKWRKTLEMCCLSGQ